MVDKSVSKDSSRRRFANSTVALGFLGMLAPTAAMIAPERAQAQSPPPCDPAEMHRLRQDDVFLSDKQRYYAIQAQREQLSGMPLDQTTRYALSDIPARRANNARLENLIRLACAQEGVNPDVAPGFDAPGVIPLPLPFPGGRWGGWNGNGYNGQGYNGNGGVSPRQLQQQERLQLEQQQLQQKRLQLQGERQQNSTTGYSTHQTLPLGGAPTIPPHTATPQGGWQQRTTPAPAPHPANAAPAHGPRR